MVITFEVIREFHRKERESSRLQPLPETFFRDVMEYMKEKSKKKSDPIDYIELENIKMIVNGILDRRQQKVLGAAMAFVRSGVVMENMLPQERELFDEIVKILRDYRKRFWEEIQEREEEEAEETPETPEHPAQEESPEDAPEEEEPSFEGLYLPLKDLPLFIWRNGKKYKISRDSAVRLPEDLAKFLEKKGIVKRLEA